MANLVIPAAGSATRLQPLSANTSKIMVRVNGKPCLDYIVESAKKSSEIEEIVVVDGAFDDIRRYCSNKHPEIKFAKQPELKGPRDAVMIGLNALECKETSVVVWLGDAIILHDELPIGTDFLLCKEVDDHSAWCMWDGKNYWDKPKENINNAHALVGLYSFKDAKLATECFNESDSYDISDALKRYQEFGAFEKILTEEWYDIGELQTYYKTCASLLNQKSRIFNNLVYDPTIGTITKLPDYHDESSIQKIKNEKNWYASLNNEQSFFTPRIMREKNELTMSYEAGTLLSDLMLYDDLPSSVWEYILNKVFEIKRNYFEEALNHEFIDFSEESRKMWLGKSEERIKRTTFSNGEKSKLLEIAQTLWKKTRPINCMHGDLHLGNILYNQTTDQFKFIDPRGQYGDLVETTLGDNLYDYCKLSHDLIHGYNAMQNGVEHNRVVTDVFVKLLKKHGLPIKEIHDGGLLLLATCIPLHYEDAVRQERFMRYVQSKL